MHPLVPESSPERRQPTDGMGAGRAPLSDWLEDIKSAFARTAKRRGVFERQFRIADASVRLCTAGPEMLEQLGPALDHLADDSGEEALLTIAAWDSPDEMEDAPPLPETDREAPRGAVFYAAEESRRVAYQPGLGQLSAHDAGDATAWFWCQSAAELPFWERAAPLRQILHWWLAANGLMLLHGASVGLREGGVLLAGRGGSGKSTCALASLASNLLYAGDDYVVVREAPEPYVFSLYSSGKLQPGHAKLLTHLPPPEFPGDGTPDEKAVFYVRDHFPERMCSGFPLRAVLVPRVTGTAVQLAPVPPAEALRALAPSTLLQLHPAHPESFAQMARLLQRLPAYALELGGPPDLIPPTIERLLTGLTQREGAGGSAAG